MMNGPVLVTYATRSGSTAGIAEAIAKTLADKGLPVDVCPMHEVKDISPLPGRGRGQRDPGAKVASRGHAVYQ